MRQRKRKKAILQSDSSEDEQPVVKKEQEDKDEEIVKAKKQEDREIEVVKVKNNKQDKRKKEVIKVEKKKQEDKVKEVKAKKAQQDKEKEVVKVENTKQDAKNEIKKDSEKRSLSSFFSKLRPLCSVFYNCCIFLAKSTPDTANSEKRFEYNPAVTKYDPIKNAFWKYNEK